MTKLTTIAAALLLAGTAGAFAGHLQVADPARTSDSNQSGNAAKGWDKVSTNPSDGKAAKAADKTSE